MSEIRDYGTIGGVGKTGVSITTNRRRQVYLATHDGSDKRLPVMKRSFISFSYGGKWIEDFDLIATFSNNGLSKNGYATFDDKTSTYDNLEGQYYWGTHYRTNSLEFKLSTDGIDDKKLNDFLYWFKAGTQRELILAEHPNRAIIARVSSPPQLELLPFEEPVNIKISNVEYPTSTTLYKGDIKLNFVMDDPHWYALKNILGVQKGTRYVDDWVNDDGTVVSIFASKDALKILYEDGIPLGSMIDANMLLGNGAYANAETNISSRIWDPDSTDTVVNRRGLVGGGACIDGDYAGRTYVGQIAGAIVDISGNGIESLAGGVQAYFFYAGTAPSPTQITFTLVPQLTNYYVTTPCNSHSGSGAPRYNTLRITCSTQQDLQFTTPNLLTSYNKTIEIFDTNINAGSCWEDIYALVRDGVRHPAVRKWANLVIKFGELNYGENGLIKNPNVTNLKKYMSYMLMDDTASVFPMTVSFNSKNGEAIGYLKYRLLPGAVSSPPSDDAGWLAYQGSENSVHEVEEDVGDMLRSNYIIIKDRNYPTEGGKIVNWRSDNDTTKAYSHMIMHDVIVPLTNLQIIYKNMYL